MIAEKICVLIFGSKLQGFSILIHSSNKMQKEVKIIKGSILKGGWFKKLQSLYISKKTYQERELINVNKLFGK